MKSRSLGFATNSSSYVVVACIPKDKFENIFVKTDVIYDLLDEFSDRNQVDIVTFTNRYEITFRTVPDDDLELDSIIQDSINRARRIFDSYGIKPTFDWYHE